MLHNISDVMKENINKENKAEHILSFASRKKLIWPVIKSGGLCVSMTILVNQHYDTLQCLSFACHQILENYFPFVQSLSHGEIMEIFL